MKNGFYIAFFFIVFSSIGFGQNIQDIYPAVSGMQIISSSIDSANVEGRKVKNNPNSLPTPNVSERQVQSTSYLSEVATGALEKGGPPPSVYLAPINDNCSGATTIIPGVTLVAQTNAGASFDVASGGCFNNLGDNVWYVFTVPAGGGSYNLTVTCSSNMRPDIAIIQFATACTFSGATQIACNGYANGTGTKTTVSLTANCLAAGTYYIDMDSEASTGIFSISLTSTGVVSNDCCNNASPISLAATAIVGSYTGTTTGTNVGATADGLNSGCFNANKNVWYYFDAPVAGNYFISVQGGSIVYPEISILTGSCASFVEQSCAGALGGTVYGTEHPYGFFAGVPANPYAYGGMCSATLNQRIYVMIDNYTGGSAGTFTLNVVTLKNDNINQGLIISSCGSFFNSSTIGATNCDNGSGDAYYNNLDGNTTICNGNGVQSGGDGSGNAGNAANSAVCINGGDVGYSVENDSWYEFCVTATTTVSITFVPTMSSCLPTPNGTSGLQIALFTGSPSSLTKVGGGYNGENITTSTNYGYTIAANGCTYIEVDGFAGTNCDYTLKVDLTPTCVLPIELLSFTADNQQGRIKLDWASATETNAAKYIIGRSSNGIDYTSILSTKAKGNSTSQTNYTLYDENPVVNSVNYYKLAEVDFNGKENLLSQIAVTNKAGFPHFSVYPNPSNGKTNINISNFSSPSVEVEIIDIYGRIVWNSTIVLDNGKNLQQVDLSGLESGIYFVKATDENNKLYKQSLIISNH